MVTPCPCKHTVVFPEFARTVVSLSSQRGQKTHEKYSALMKRRFGLILKDCKMFCCREYLKMAKLCVGFLTEQMMST